MKAKLLSISFHLFFRIGPFQRVTAEKIKKICPASNSRLGLCFVTSNAIRSPSEAGRASGVTVSCSSEDHSTVILFLQTSALIF
jgi:hypothetical protein